MTRIEALKDLMVKVDDGTCESINARSAFKDIDECINVVRAYHGSLAAAKALHDALLQGWVTWDASHTYFGYEWSITNGEDTVYACCKDNPSRAWLLAILKALIAQEEAG